MIMYTLTALLLEPSSRIRKLVFSGLNKISHFQHYRRHIKYHFNLPEAMNGGSNEVVFHI